VEFYINLIEKYSLASSFDYLRIAVIKSLKDSMQNLMKFLNLSSMEGLTLFFCLYRSFFRLLQDEIPETREKIAKFLNKYVFGTFNLL